MLKFLFRKSRPESATAPVAAPKRAVPEKAEREAAAGPAVRPEDVTALAEGDPAIATHAVSAGPLETALAALARIRDEATLARVALEGRLADARHAAAARLSEEAHLQRVAQQSKTSDKRVYKVVRDKIEHIERQRREGPVRERLLATARSLAAAAEPDSHQAVELERAWAALLPDALADDALSRLRAAWQARFQEIAEVRRREQSTPSPTAAQTAAADAENAAEGPDAAASEAPSGGEPGAGFVATDESLSATASSSPVDGAAGHSPDSGSPHPPDAVAELPADAAPLRQKTSGKRTPRTTADPEIEKSIADKLKALEEALEAGELHEAESKLGELSKLQSDAGGVAGALGGRIRRAAEEISRLRGWRRYGGQHARSTLVDTAEALVRVELEPTERGRAVRALREQWIELAKTEGPAPHSLRERFEKACEKSWEPVRAHFEEQAKRRTASEERRASFLSQLETQVKNLQNAPVDWRAVAQSVAEAPERWRRMGHAGRAAKGALDERFKAAIAELDRRLKSTLAFEDKEREALISRAEYVASRTDDRDQGARIKAIQAEWQQRTRTVPLDRAREQELWERLSKVCDSVFAARDAERAAERAEADARDKAEAERFQKQQDEWRVVRESSLALAALETASHGAPPTDADAEAAAANVRAVVETQQSALRPLARKLSQGLLARAERLAGAIGSASGRDEIARAIEADKANLEREILLLEIGLHLESPPEFKAERTKLQLSQLADSMRTGGRGDAEALAERAAALLALPVGSSPSAQRLDAILAKLAPQKSAVSAHVRGAEDRRPRRDRDERRPGEGRPPRGRGNAGGGRAAN